MEELVERTVVNKKQQQQQQNNQQELQDSIWNDIKPEQQQQKYQNSNQQINDLQQQNKQQQYQQEEEVKDSIWNDIKEQGQNQNNYYNQQQQNLQQWQQQQEEYESQTVNYKEMQGKQINSEQNQSQSEQEQDFSETVNFKQGEIQHQNNSSEMAQQEEDQEEEETVNYKEIQSQNPSQIQQQQIQIQDQQQQQEEDEETVNFKEIDGSQIQEQQQLQSEKEKEEEEELTVNFKEINIIKEDQQQEQLIQKEYVIEKDVIDKYKYFLVFKVYGKGAFGEVTEFYDIVNRERLAKKYFAQKQYYLQEKEVMEKLKEVLGQQIMEEVILNTCKFDDENQSIYYRAGNCTLSDLCDKRREENLWWFNNEKELFYVVIQLYDFIQKMAERNVFHSDIKPVNTCFVYNERGLEQYDLKLIDMGGACFQYDMLVAYTKLYYPEQGEFDPLQSKDSRIKGEIYQVGRVLQEVCLSSIYGYNSHLYHKQCQKEFGSGYQEFKKYYMANNKERREESLQLIQEYYSLEVYELVKGFLEYGVGVQECSELIENIRKKECKYFRDTAELIKIIEQEQIDEMFGSIQREGDKLWEELEFYLQFDFDKRGLKRVQDEIKNRHEEDYKKLKFSGFPQLAVYETIFQTRCQQSKESKLIKNIEKMGEVTKQQQQQDQNYIQQEYQNEKLIGWDRDYEPEDENFIKGIPQKQQNQGNFCQISAMFQSPCISDRLKLQFFSEVVGKIAHFDEYLNKEVIEKIVELLGFEDEDYKYEDVILKYMKFFYKGSALIYNESLVKKTIKNLEKSIEEEEGNQEIQEIFYRFIFQIRCLYIEACYKKLEESVKNNVQSVDKIDEAIVQIKEIKRSEYSKQMQFLLLVKGSYYMKKLEIQEEEERKKKNNEQEEEDCEVIEKEKLKLLNLAKEALELCQRNMVKVGSLVEKYEVQLFKLLAVLSDKLEQFEECSKYEYLAMQKYWEDGGKTDLDKFIVNQKFEEYSDFFYPKMKKLELVKEYYKEYFELTWQWSGYNLANKQIFLSLRADAYAKKIDVRGNDQKFKNNLENQRQILKDRNQLPMYTQWGEWMEKWVKNIKGHEEKNDKKYFQVEMSEFEKENIFDVFSCQFKLDYIRFLGHNFWIRDFKGMYEFIEYLKNKYIDFQEKLNDIGLMEMYVASIEKNEKKFNRAKRELEDLSGKQAHQLTLVRGFYKENCKELQNWEQNVDQKYFHNWQCGYCEGDLKYFENKDFWKTRYKKMDCQGCSRSLQRLEDQYVWPCWGCECNQKWGEYSNETMQIAILQGGQMERVFKEFRYQESYYVCLQCMIKKKNLCNSRCIECKGQLVRGKDPYQNQHRVDGLKGYCCKKQGCGKERQNGVCYWCPNCKSQKGSKYAQKFLPYEDKYTICQWCINQIPGSYDYNQCVKDDAQEFLRYQDQVKQIEKQEDQVTYLAESRKNIYAFHQKRYQGFDFQLVYHLFDYRYKHDWEKYYQQELAMKLQLKQQQQQQNYMNGISNNNNFNNGQSINYLQEQQQQQSTNYQQQQLQMPMSQYQDQRTLPMQQQLQYSQQQQQKQYQQVPQQQQQQIPQLQQYQQQYQQQQQCQQYQQCQQQIPQQQYQQQQYNNQCYQPQQQQIAYQQQQIPQQYQPQYQQQNMQQQQQQQFNAPNNYNQQHGQYGNKNYQQGYQQNININMQQQQQNYQQYPQMQQQAQFKGQYYNGQYYYSGQHPGVNYQQEQQKYDWGQYRENSQQQQQQDLGQYKLTKEEQKKQEKQHNWGQYYK